MSTFDIASGTELSLSASPPQDRPAVAADTPRFPSMATPDAMPAADTVGMQQQRLSQGRQDVAAAQAAGQARESDRRSGYANDMLPTGAEYGDLLPLPPVVSDWSKHTGGSDAASYDPAG